MELFAYFIVVLMLSITPGPGMILNMVIALNQGFKSSFMSLLGMSSGITFYAIVTFFFIELLSENPIILNLIQLLDY